MCQVGEEMDVEIQCSTCTDETQVQGLDAEVADSELKDLKRMDLLN